MNNYNWCEIIEVITYDDICCTYQFFPNTFKDLMNENFDKLSSDEKNKLIRSYIPEDWDSQAKAKEMFFNFDLIEQWKILGQCALSQNIAQEMKNDDLENAKFVIVRVNAACSPVVTGPSKLADSIGGIFSMIKADKIREV